MSAVSDALDPTSILRTIQEQISHISAARSAALAARSKLAALADFQDGAFADLEARSAANRGEAERLLERALSLRAAAAKGVQTHAAEVHALSQSLDRAAREKGLLESSLGMTVNSIRLHFFSHPLTSFFIYV